MVCPFYEKILRSLISGVLIGVVIGVFQYSFRSLAAFGNTLWTNGAWWSYLLNLLLNILFFAIIYRLIYLMPSLSGSGVPLTIEVAHGKKKGNHLLMIPFAFISLLGSFLGFPLGSEGPSVLLGGGISSFVDGRTSDKEREKETTAIGAGAGFGAAFLSPLAGVCYAFEEMGLHHRSQTKLYQKIILAIITSLVAFIIAFLIDPHHLLAIEGLEMFSWNFSYLWPLLVLIIAPLAYIIEFLFLLIRRLLYRFNNHFWVAIRLALLFIVIFVLSFFFRSFLGGGSSLFLNLGNNLVLSSIVLLLFLRILISLLASESKTSGGLVMPSLLIGGLLSLLFLALLQDVFLFSSREIRIFVLMGALLFLAIFNKIPLTSGILLFSTLLYLKVDFLSSFLVFLFYLPFAYLVTLPEFLHLVPDLYDGFLMIEVKTK